MYDNDCSHTYGRVAQVKPVNTKHAKKQRETNSNKIIVSPAITDGHGSEREREEERKDKENNYIK